jgi:hypothetical protein
MEQNPPGSSHGQPQRQPPVYDTNHGGHYGTSEAQAHGKQLFPHPLAQANVFAQQVPVLRYTLPEIPRHILHLTPEQLSGQGYAPVAELYTGAWANVRIPTS